MGAEQAWRRTKLKRWMSALGHEETSMCICLMSALPLKADIG